MDGEGMDACLRSMRWSRADLARELGCGVGTVHQWARGEVAMPPEVAHWLYARATALEAFEVAMNGHMPPPPRKRWWVKAPKRRAPNAGSFGHGR